MNPSDLFGDRDWDDVRGVVSRRLRRRFPRALSDDIEDAVSLAMVDLVDYWIQLPSSIVPDCTRQTFYRACKRGTWMATTFLTQEWDIRDVPTESLSEDRDDAPALGVGHSSTSPVEDAVLESLEKERFQRFVTDQIAEVGDWLKPFLAGTSTREQARKEGVAQQVLHRRWQRRFNSFMEAAQAAGLGAAQ